MRILVVRLGAMGDVIHTLPAVATLRASFPQAHIAWVIEPRWMPLVEGNPAVNECIPFERRSWSGLRAAWAALRRYPFELAVDFQGLLKSALTARAAGARRIAGYDWSQLREPAAGLLYSERRRVEAAHIVDRHLELARACGASCRRVEFALPEGALEAELPQGGFVLASPFAGWPAKEWPLDRYEALGALLERRAGLPLVLSGRPQELERLRAIKHTIPYICSLTGLIAATRLATAVVGVDSGPLHLAAALAKPGVALYGPTDPARNGPYGGSIRVLRSAGAVTSYQRKRVPDPSMLAIEPAMVFEALEQCLEKKGC